MGAVNEPSGGHSRQGPAEPTASRLGGLHPGRVKPGDPAAMAGPGKGRALGGDWAGAAGTALAAILAMALVGVSVALLAPQPLAAGPRGLQVAVAGLVVLGLGGDVDLDIVTRDIGAQVLALPTTLTAALVAVLALGARARLRARPLRVRGDLDVLVFALQTGVALAVMGLVTAFAGHATLRGLGPVGRDVLRVSPGYTRTGVIALLWGVLVVGIVALVGRPGLWQRTTRGGLPLRRLRGMGAPVVALLAVLLLAGGAYAGLLAATAEGHRREASAAWLADVPATGPLAAAAALGVPIRDGSRALLAVDSVLGNGPDFQVTPTATESLQELLQRRYDAVGDLGYGGLLDRSPAYVVFTLLVVLALVFGGAVRAARGGPPGLRPALLAGLVTGTSLTVTVYVVTVRALITGPVLYGGVYIVRPALGLTLLFGLLAGTAGALLGAPLAARVPSRLTGQPRQGPAATPPAPPAPPARLGPRRADAEPPSRAKPPGQSAESSTRQRRAPRPQGTQARPAGPPVQGARPAPPTPPRAAPGRPSGPRQSPPGQDPSRKGSSSDRQKGRERRLGDHG